MKALRIGIELTTHPSQSERFRDRPMRFFGTRCEIQYLKDTGGRGMYLESPHQAVFLSVCIGLTRVVTSIEEPPTAGE